MHTAHARIGVSRHVLGWTDEKDPRAPPPPLSHRAADKIAARRRRQRRASADSNGSGGGVDAVETMARLAALTHLSANNVAFDCQPSRNERTVSKLESMGGGSVVRSNHQDAELVAYEEAQIAQHGEDRATVRAVLDIAASLQRPKRAPRQYGGYYAHVQRKKASVGVVVSNQIAHTHPLSTTFADADARSMRFCQPPPTAMSLRGESPSPPSPQRGSRVRPQSAHPSQRRPGGRRRPPRMPRDDDDEGHESSGSEGASSPRGGRRQGVGEDEGGNATTAAPPRRARPSSAPSVRQTRPLTATSSASPRRQQRQMPAWGAATGNNSSSNNNNVHRRASSSAYHSLPAELVRLADRVFTGRCRDLNVGGLSDGVTPNVGANPDSQQMHRFVVGLCQRSRAGRAIGEPTTTLNLAGCNIGLRSLRCVVRFLRLSVGDGEDARAMAEYAARMRAHTTSYAGDGDGDDDDGVTIHNLHERTQYARCLSREITTLVLRGNHLGDAGANMLAELLRDNTTLETLDVRATDIGQAGFVSLWSALADNTTLTSIDVSSLMSGEGRMYMGVRGSKHLARALALHPNLRQVVIRNSGLTPEAVPMLAKGLSRAHSLVHVDLSCCRIGYAECEVLRQAFPVMPCLMTLVLADNALGDYGVLLLCQALRQMPKLCKLDLRNNGIGIGGFSLLTDAVGSIAALTSLKLDGNAFQFRSNRTIDAALQSRASSSSSATTCGVKPKSAEFRKAQVEQAVRQIGLTEGQFVSPRFLASRELAYLSLNDCQMHSKVLVQLMASLCEHESLTALLLSRNTVSLTGAKSVAQLLVASNTLEHLALSYCVMSDAAGGEVGRALQKCPSLTYLACKSNNFGAIACRAITQALAVSRTLHCDCAGNKMHFGQYAKLQQLSTRNEKQFHDNATQRYTAKMESLRSDQEKLAQKEEEVEEVSSECRVVEEEAREMQHNQPQFTRDETAITRARETEFKTTCQTTADLGNQLAQLERTITATAKTGESQENGISKYIAREKHNANTIRKQLQHALTQQQAAEEAEARALLPYTSELAAYEKDIRQISERLNRTTAALRHFVKTLEDKIDKKARAIGGKSGKSKSSSTRRGASSNKRSASSSSRPKSAWDRSRKATSSNKTKKKGKGKKKKA